MPPRNDGVPLSFRGAIATRESVFVLRLFALVAFGQWDCRGGLRRLAMTDGAMTAE